MSWAKRQTTTSTSTGSTVTSNLSGKSFMVIGDSLTEKTAKANTNYHDYIKTWSGCTIINKGISGTGWYQPNAFYNRISPLSENPDIITLFGGTNDWKLNSPLGSFGDTNGATSFYGAVDSTLSQLITKYPNKQIFIFTPIPRSDSFNGGTNGGGLTLQQFNDAIIAVANKYSIPVLDLYRNSGLMPWNTTNNTTYFTPPGGGSADGLHPNDEGHKVIAQKMYSFLNYHLGTTVS